MSDISLKQVPNIEITYHDPALNQIEFVQKFEIVKSIQVARAHIVEEPSHTVDTTDLHVADVVIPEQITKRSRYRFRWLPKNFRKRSKSLGIEEIENSDVDDPDCSLENLSFRNKYQKKKDKGFSGKISSKEAFEKLQLYSSTLMSSTNNSNDKKSASHNYDNAQSKNKQFFLKNFRSKPKGDVSGQTVNKPNPLVINNVTVQTPICSVCPPPTNKYVSENANPQLFTIEQKKEVKVHYCPHLLDPSHQSSSDFKKKGTGKSKETKTLDSIYSNRSRSISGSSYETYSHFQLPDPTKLPEQSPDSILMFSKSPLKSAGDDQLWMPSKKSDGVGYFKRPYKTSISKSEQNLVSQLQMPPGAQDHSRIIESALLQSKQGLDMGNKTIEAAVTHGISRVTENGKIIFLSKTSTRDSSKYLSEGMHTSQLSEAYCAYFLHSTCYDLMPNNSKVVVIDSRLQVGKAFRALILNGVRAAIIWNSIHQKFVGMLTISDFIKILNLYIAKGVSTMDFESQTVDYWRELINLTDKPIIFVTPESSLFIALQELLNHRVHRLPIIDSRSGNVLHIITHKRLMKYLFIKKKGIPDAPFLKWSIEKAGVGTFDKVHTLTLDTPIRTVLQMFEEKKISAVPVVDPVSKKLVDIYAKFDCIHLASTGNYNDMNLTIAQALRFRVGSFQVQTIMKTDTLEFAMEKIVRKEVHRLVVINNEEERLVEGIVSLADLLHYFVLRYGGRHSIGTDPTCCSPNSSDAAPEEYVTLPAVTAETDDNVDILNLSLPDFTSKQRRVSSPDSYFNN